jgi:hypothetical protein
MSFTVVSVTNPVYTNADGTGIDCQVQWAEFNEVHPFHAIPNDPESHGVALYNALKAGTYGPIAAYVPPPVKANTANGQPVSTGTQTI